MEHQVFELECSEPRQPSRQNQNHSVGYREDDSAKAQVPHILNLPLIIILLVLDLLDRKDVHAFGLVCRGYNRVVEPILFRKVVLNDRNSPEINLHICKRLADRHDSIAENVHHFQIEFDEIQNLPNVELLRDVLGNLTILEDFSWNARFPIPTALLEKFHTRHPYARLHAKNSHRSHFKKQYQPPDYYILSSPQLYSLDYVAYRNDPQGKGNRVAGRGELPAIKTALLQARNLKNLRLQISGSGGPTQAGWAETYNFFTFGHGEVFPALEELDISHGKNRISLDPASGPDPDANSYRLTPESCQEWAKSMDWSHLRRLNLDRLYDPQHLFEALAGKVSNLKAIKFDLHSVHSLLRFSDSIDGLEEISISDYWFNVFDEAREAFFSKHGHSLKKLHIDCMPWNSGFAARDMQRLVKIAPGIRSLKLDVSSEHDNYMDWPEATMELLSELQHLRRLDVSIRLQGIPEGQHETEVLRANILTRDERRRSIYLKEEVAEERVKAFYKQVLGNDQYSKIHCVKVTFETLAPLNAWPLIVHRESPDGQRFRLEKGLYTRLGIQSSFMRHNNSQMPAGVYLSAFD